MTHSRTRDAKAVLVRYAVAVCSAGAGWALRLTLSAALHSTAPYITFIPAILFSAWFGGRGPGILATAMSLAATFCSVILPFRDWRWPTLSDVVGALIFMIVSVFLTFEVARKAEAEAELAEAKGKAERDRDLLSTTLSSIGDAVIAADADGQVTFLNAVAQALTGWNQADAAGKALSAVFVIRDEMTGLALENPAARAMREGMIVGLANHTVLVSKDGRAIPIEDSAAPIRDGQQRVLGVVLVFRDVTKRRRAEEALQRSEERLKLALDAGQIGVWDWDVVQNRVEWSELVHDIHGVERGRFAGGMEDFAKLVHPEDRGRVTGEILAAIQQNTPYDVEFRVIHPNGDVHWVATTALIFLDEKGEARRMLGATTDITARKKAEAHLLQQWHTFDTALSYTPDFTYIFDREGRFTYVNRALLSLWQKPLEEAVGKNFFDLGYPAELAQQLQRQIQEVIHTKQPVRDETPFAGPTGETRHYEYIFVPVLDAGGRVEAVAGSTRDVTERNRNEEALRKSEERLTFALEAGGGVGTWDWELPSDRLYCNPQFAKLYSVDPERAAAGAPIAEFLQHIHPDDKERVGKKIQVALETGGDLAEEYRIVQQDGSVRWVYTRGRCQLDEDGKPMRFPGAAFDVTERKRAEEALLESQNRLRAIYDGTYEYIGLLAPDGTLLEANRASLTFANNTRADVVGRRFWDTPWFAYTPGAPEVVRDGVARAAAGEFVRFEAVLRRPTGECPTFDISFHPVRNELGEVVLIVPEGRDISVRKRAEEELTRSNEELRRVNRELEEFAYVASHDLQEPLRMVNIYTQIILKEVGLKDGGAESAKLGKYADFVRQGVTRMEALIQDLLTFSRAVHDDELPIATANLSAALDEALYVLKNPIEESGCCITTPVLPTVRGDTAQMAHVFQNLISNALKYRKNGTAPQIGISFQQSGNDWVISVKDDGIGFEPQYAERIFGLFKRLHKEEYPGTGLGLAICRRIVERYGGRTWAEGKPGAGATFYFSLPKG
jgi:PAS domain S-box-containing protein